MQPAINSDNLFRDTHHMIDDSYSVLEELFQVKGDHLVSLMRDRRPGTLVSFTESIENQAIGAYQSILLQGGSLQAAHEAYHNIMRKIVSVN